MHISIAGNIGAGKTTLAELLANHYGWDAHYEKVEDNPYLDDFYRDMLRWSFNLQIYFLNSRFNQILEIRKRGKPFIQDRTIYEDAHIFAPSLHSMGLMASRDYENYFSLFNLLSSLIHPPDLLIYLQADVSTLIHNIEKRGREYEKNIRTEYLSKLNQRYEAWIKTYNLGKMIIVSVDNKDFRSNHSYLEEIIEQIDKHLQ